MARNNVLDKLALLRVRQTLSQSTRPSESHSHVALSWVVFHRLPKAQIAQAKRTLRKSLPKPQKYVK